MAAREAEVAIVGAGVVGLTLALRLARAGREVVLIDPNPPGSGARRGLPGRESSTCHPRIGCTPACVQASLNSSAPNRLPESVIATAGIAARAASEAIFSVFIAPSLSE